LQECIQTNVALSRELEEVKTLDVAEVVILCKENWESISDSMLELVRDDSATICLAVYTGLSLLWGILRLVHMKCTGPSGRRFPPDEAFLWLITVTFHYVWDRCTKNDISGEGEESVSSAHSDRQARLRAFLEHSRNNVRVAQARVNIMHAATSMPGPSFNLATINETGAQIRPLSIHTLSSYLPVATLPLNERVGTWVEDSADSGRPSAPTSELQSDGDTTLIGDAPEGASNVSEASYGSTEQETGTNEPEGPDSGRGTSTQVRFVKRCLYNFEIILFYENSK
jgi:hypothetical protein